MALLTILLVGTPVQAKAPRVPMSLKKSIECMYKVLKTAPGVSEPKVGYVTSDGWTHPFIEYRAAEHDSWLEPTRFDVRRSGHHKYYFLAILPGIVPPGGHLDFHVTDAVTQKWRTECKVDAVVLLE